MSRPSLRQRAGRRPRAPLLLCALGTLGGLLVTGRAAGQEDAVDLPAALGEPPAHGHAAPGERPPADHVVLVSVDGLRPEFYLERRWPAPNLQEMAADGARADAVRGVVPTVTYPSHTTMITGALPARHGIPYNTPFEPGGQTGRWYWYADSITAPTLWDAVRASGGTTAGVSWPVSVGAAVDWLIPEIWPLEEGVDPIRPIREHARPEGLLEEIEREATGRLTAANFTLEHMTRDDKAGAMAAYLLERHRPAFLAVHLVETDHFQHDHGREHPTVRRAVGAVDRAIGQIREAAERAGIIDRTAFVVTGDHGFVDTHTLLAPNAWLVEAGLHDPDRRPGAWRAAFHPAGGSAYLHLADPDDRETLEAVRGLLSELPRPIRRLFRVVERDELERRGAAPGAALALDASPGIAFSGSPRPPARRPASGGTHGHLPDTPLIHTGFVAWGAGIRPGTVVHRMGLEDIAPLVAALLGLDFPTPDGTFYPGLLADPPVGPTP